MADSLQMRGQAASAAGGPLYLQLVHHLRRDLAGGLYAPGSRLPSEEELCRQHSMSRHTVREALRRLREDGLVMPRKGAGTVVVGPQKASMYAHEIASVEQLLEYAADIPLTVSMTKSICAGHALAKHLGCAEGEKWMLIAGLRHPRGQALPTCWTEVYLRAEFADMPPLVGQIVGQTVGPIYTWIEQRHGQVITDIEQLLTGRVIPARIAARLGVPPGSAGIEMRRTFRLGTGRVGQIAVNLHPAARFRYATKLKRTIAP